MNALNTNKHDFVWVVQQEDDLQLKRLREEEISDSDDTSNKTNKKF